MALRAADKKIIAECPLFIGLEPSVLEHIYSAGQVYAYQKGAQMDCSGAISILLSGRACIQRIANDERSVVLDYVGPGRAIGPAQIFITEAVLSQPYALTALQTFVLTKEVIESLLKEHVSLQKNYIRFLSDRISFLTSKIASLTGSTVEDRLLYYIHEHADTNGTLCVRSFTELAALLNIGRASLYRAIDALKETNAIALKNHTFTLL